MTSPPPIKHHPAEPGQQRPIDNKIFVLILQHPQEKKRELGTGRLLVSQLTQAKITAGLSWSNLKGILQRDVQPQNWAVLFLGAAKDKPPQGYGPVIAVDRQARPLNNQDQVLKNLQGLIVLDGTWSQAKTLWWRNPWLLRLQRIILNPDRPSAYGRLRREPRKTALSTIEAAALALGYLEQRPDLEEHLERAFHEFVSTFQAQS